MANKNSKRFAALLRKEKNVAIEIPNHGYHNSPKGSWKVRRASLGNCGFKKKAKHFPAVGEPISLINQIKIFYGAACTLA